MLCPIGRTDLGVITMTDEKSKTPGMAEVSVEFEHEIKPEGMVPAVASDPLLALRAERASISAEIAATPEDKDAALWPRLEDVERRILTTEPQTLLGALAQIEVLVSMAHEGVPTFAVEAAKQLDEQIPARIEGLIAGAGEDPVLALKREWDVRRERLHNEPDETDAVRDPLVKAATEIEFAIHRTPATTLEGVALKLRLWTRIMTPELGSRVDWWKDPIADMHGLEHMPVASALQDLERMAGKGQS